MAYGCGANVGVGGRRGVGIRIGRSNGKGRARAITHSRFDSFPDWSPSGKSIVFTRYPGESLDPPEIWIYRRGRSSRLTQGEQPAWSVKGEIVFMRDIGPKGEEGASGDFADIYAIRPNGKGLRRLTQGFEPEWSPHGSKIIFSTNACGYHCLYTIQRDGRRKRRMGGGIGGEQPDFSPGGGQVVFAGLNQILVMRSNGTRERVLFETATDFWVSDPDWQSLPPRPTRRRSAPCAAGVRGAC